MRKETIRGDGSGAVIELGLIVPEHSRCDFEDEHGRCRNDKIDGDMFCAWHRELVLLRSECEKNNL